MSDNRGNISYQLELALVLATHAQDEFEFVCFPAVWFTFTLIARIRSMVGPWPLANNAIGQVFVVAKPGLLGLYADEMYLLNFLQPDCAHQDPWSFSPMIFHGKTLDIHLLDEGDLDCRPTSQVRFLCPDQSLPMD